MTINTTNLPWAIDDRLRHLLEGELEKAKIEQHVGAILTFRDPEFTAASGGFHPVEVAIGPGGNIEYLTDFAYFGIPPHCELAKELDFDFSLNLFQHFGVEYPIQQGRELFQLWQSNFLAYHEMGVYTVSVEPMG